MMKTTVANALLAAMLLLNNHVSPSFAASVEEHDSYRPVPTFVDVDKGHKHDRKSGIEEVDVQVILEENIADITDAEYDFMASAFQFAFDDTSPNHKYHSSFAYLDHIEAHELDVLTEEDEEEQSTLRGGAGDDNKNSKLKNKRTQYLFDLRYYSAWACELCTDDDSFMSNTASSTTADITQVFGSSLANRRETLKNWGDAICDLYRHSHFPGLQNAKECHVTLPNGGVALAPPSGGGVDAVEEEEDSLQKTTTTTNTLSSMLARLF